MKILDVARPNWGAVAVAALAGTAVGFAAGFVVGRDPAAARRATGRATQWAATGVEQATLWAAQLREHIGDLWAEAREASLGAVDAADFQRHAAAATTAAASSGPTPAQPATRGGTPTASKRRSKPDVDLKARAKPRADTRAGAKAPVGSDKAEPGTKGVRASRRKVEATPV